LHLVNPRVASMNPAGGLSEATILTSGWTYVAFGLLGWWNHKRGQRRTAEAVGEVTTGTKWWHEDPQVKLQFRAQTGELVSFSTNGRYQVGDSVDVVYDPADCKNAAVKAGSPTHPLVAVGFCVLLILCGLGWEVFRWSR
jgi:hypothetical protein